jgi:hypothetical protein
MEWLHVLSSWGSKIDDQKFCLTCESWGSHGGNCEEWWRLGCDLCSLIENNDIPLKVHKFLPGYKSQMIILFIVLRSLKICWKWWQGILILSPNPPMLWVSWLYNVKDRMINESGPVSGMRIGRGNWGSRRKPVTMPLCLPQIQHDLTWDWTQASTLGNCWPTTWGMAYTGFRSPVPNDKD